MTVTGAGFAVGLGAALRYVGAQAALDGRVRVHRWRLDLAVVDHAAVARYLAAAYIDAPSRWGFPDADVRLDLPGLGTTARKGDFGEIVAAALYSQRLGWQVPFHKLQAQPVAGATLPGPDLLALTLTGPGDLTGPDELIPVVTEVKTRPTFSPGALLREIAGNLARTDADYLASAWRAGVRGLRSRNPDARRAYAWTAAQHLARLNDPQADYPPHERHAVVLTRRDSLTVAKINQYWAPVPPASQLHVVMVDDLEAAMDDLYATAAGLDYADLASGAPRLLGTDTYLPGLSAPVSSSAAADLVARDGGVGLLTVCEVALWLLADWDGMGIARARTVEARADDAIVQGLAALLAGAAARGRAHLRGSGLDVFADLVAAAWARTAITQEVITGTCTIADGLGDTVLSQAVRHVGAAIAHRLPRHPAALTEAAGARGRNVRHIVDRMQHVGQRALWPSQAAAVAGGLLDRGYPSLAVQMPTSAGKTTLIELLVADTLDLSGGPVVAVLAPTKALAAQLARDLRGALPDDVPVRSSHGGLDFDTDQPGTAAILADYGACVMTPERFDMEWRRAATGDGPATIDALKLLVVDEAHLLTETNRGARLELVIARALRRGIRVVLLSSQFPNPAELARWLEGRAIESRWGSTWLQRYVYYRSDDATTGLLRPENGPAVPVLPLKPSDRSPGDACPRERPAETAAIAHQSAGEGLVVIYTNEKSRFTKLATSVEVRFDAWPDADPQLLGLADLIAPVDGQAAGLLRTGIGIHHGSVHRLVRQVVETAARTGLLRCVICTPTLLEGVDFPTRTVIAAYPPRDRRGVPQVAKLRNLAGRAGRGGRFTSGTLIVMTDEEDQATKWLKAFRSGLPATRSALALALDQLHATASTLLDPGSLQPADAIDILVLAAVAESATVDGDLRTVLEAALGRTLWYATTPPSLRERTLQMATHRAHHVARLVGDPRWSHVFYRTGMPVASCLALRDVLAPDAHQFAQELRTPWKMPDDRLLWLAAEIAPRAQEMSRWTALPTSGLRAVLERWLCGDPTDEIIAAHPDIWPQVELALDTLLPWVLTAAIDIAAVHVGDPDLRDLAHHRLTPARLRYGVPHAELCDLVRRGYDRVEVACLARQWESEVVFLHPYQPMVDYITDRAQPLLAGNDDIDASADSGETGASQQSTS